MANFKKSIFLLLLLLSAAASATSSPPRGEWVLLQRSIGISAMHMQLLRTGHVVVFDRTDFGASNLSLPRGVPCRLNDAVSVPDCSAHSLLYDAVSNTFRPLNVETDVWCSSGAVDPTGVLVQTGGFLSGDRRVRLFFPGGTDWVELEQILSVRRWYASNQILPDGHVIIVGGRKQFNYEFFPKNNNNNSSKSSTLFKFPFLKSTSDLFEENNLYPFLHLLPNGDLFVFANRRSIQFDYRRNRVVREFPSIPGEKRNYPSSGSSVLLPLRENKINNNSIIFPDAEIMVCGGAPDHAFYKANNLSIYVSASKTCGRLRVLDPEPHWEMETMPMNRVMSDMLLLPAGDVLIVNGASNGTAGWEDAVGAVLNPVLYRPNEPESGKRFDMLSPTVIPRMYHSSAVLLPDGRVLVGGSNPHRGYNFTVDKYPTELSLEAFFPPYLDKKYAHLRPSILTVEIQGDVIFYGQIFSLTFMLPFSDGYESFEENTIDIALIAPSFTTHSFAMNQRLVFLNIKGVEKLSEFGYKATLLAPISANVAPPGYYMLFVIHSRIPGECVWIRISN